jgi:hypothetical protein
VFGAKLDLSHSGAEFDGTTDDHAKLQKYIDGNGAEPYWLPPKTALVSDQLVFPPGSSLHGANRFLSKILSTAGAPAIQGMGDFEADDFTIEGGAGGILHENGGMAFVRNLNIRSGNIGVRVIDADYHELDKLFVVSSGGGVGISSFGTPGSISNVNSSNNAGGGLRVGGPGHVNIDNAILSDNGGHGFLAAQKTGGFTITGSRADNNGSSGFTSGRTNAANVDQSWHWTMNGCVALGNGSHGFAIDPAMPDNQILVPQYGTLSGCVAGENGTHGVFVNRADLVDVNGGIMYDNGSNGILVANSRGITIDTPTLRGNATRGIGLFATTTPGAGDIVVAHPNYTLQPATFFDNGGHANVQVF